METIAVIRNIFLIVASGLFIGMVLVGGVMTFRFYRSARRSVRNVEEFFRDVIRPLSNIVEKAGPVIRLVQRLRSGERRSEDDQVSPRFNHRSRGRDRGRSRGRLVIGAQDRKRDTADRSCSVPSSSAKGQGVFG